jgi:lysophospholipase L1-like esterase
MGIIRKAAIVAGITLVTYLVADWSLGLYYHYRMRELPPSLDGIPGLKGEPYAVPEFGLEAQESSPVYTIPGTRLLWPREYHGQFFNIDRLAPTESYYRRTVDPPVTKQPPVVVLFLGGSTVYGPDTPDGLTIASQLSTILNAEDTSHSYVVLNAGVTGLDSTMERERLAYELNHGLKPGIVVVLDGGLDLVGGFYLGAPGRPPMTGRTYWAELFYKYFPINIYRRLSIWASERAVRLKQKKAPETVSDPHRLEKLLAETARVYEQNQMAMAKLAAGVGARFITVLEPNRYGTSYTHQTPDLDYVARQTDGHMPGFSGLLPTGLKALGDAQAELRAQGIDTLDLSAVFKDKTGNIFTTTTAHLNAEGSRVVAERIAGVILGQVPVSQQ